MSITPYLYYEDVARALKSRCKAIKKQTVRKRARSLPALSKAVAVCIVLGVQIACAWPAWAGLESGVYQTLPGATVEERGDQVPNGRRVMPFSATLTFDLSADPPSLAATISNAVLEGGNPFALTVRSSSGARLMDGTYRLKGGYLQEIYPSGTQYLFDWKFSTSTNGQVVWNGGTGWAGGHIWHVTISDITLVPQARLSIVRVGTASVQITWATNFADHILEYATSLPAAGWSAVTNTAAITGDRLSVTVETSRSNRFYRLRKP